MAERPILFSGPMVRAILDGRKTQTRRVLKPQPPQWATFCQQLSMFTVQHGWVPSGLWQWCEPETTPPTRLRRWPIHQTGPMAGDDYGLRTPYALGDRLWVREAWALGYALDDDEKPIEPQNIYYRADDEPFSRWLDPDSGEWRDGIKWRPSIYMPRGASRITLEVTEVRVHRLQDISEGDAIAEGAYVGKASGRYADDIATMVIEGRWFATARGWYADLWDRINGPGSRDENPWVAAYTFKPVSQKGAA
jgi:hypothetical protein